MNTNSPQFLPQSVIVLLILLVVLVLGLPDIIGFFTEPTTYQKQIVLNDGTIIDCVVYEDYNAGGLDCFLEEDSASDK